MHDTLDRGRAAPDQISVALERALHTREGLLDRLPVGVYACDRDGVVVEYNRRAAELWGRTPVPGDPTERFGGTYRAFHLDGRPLDLAQAPMREVIESGQPVRDREIIIERPDGTRRHILANIEPLFDADGRIIGGVNCFQDISELKIAREKLTEQDQRLTATYEHATIGISEIDAEGTLLRVNETVCAITGFSREELLGRNVFDITHPEDRAPDRATYTRLLRENDDRYAVEKRLVRKDGEVIWVLVRSSSVRDSGGRFLYGIRVLQDITERKRAEERLRASEHRLRNLLDALPAAIYTTDAAGRITFYNQAAVELSGSRPQLGVDEWCVSWRLFTPDGVLLPHDQCPMAVALKENRPVRGVEAVVARPDGTRIPVLPYPTPMRDTAGALIGAVNMLVDISERKQAEARQKLLVDELNHRVKNTLATVQSLATQTARGAPSPEAFRERLEGRLVALSQAHDQLSQRNWEHADLRAIAAATLSPFRLEGNDAVMITGEPIALNPKSALAFAMIFHELATNAAKYGALSQPSGRLTVSWKTWQNGAGPELRVEWRESDGPAVAQPGRRGFGTLLVERGIEAELGGKARLDFAPAGVTCEIEVPLANGR